MIRGRTVKSLPPRASSAPLPVLPLLPPRQVPGQGRSAGRVLTDEQVVVHPLRNFTYELCSGEECFRHGLAVAPTR